MLLGVRKTRRRRPAGRPRSQAWAMTPGELTLFPQPPNLRATSTVTHGENLPQMAQLPAYPHLFEPIDLGRLRLRNRLMMTTHGPRLSQARYLRYLEERARGGVALVGVNAGFGIFGYPTGTGRRIPGQAADFDAIAPDPTTPRGIADYDKTVIPMLREQGEAVHRGGALCFGQLYHPGANRNMDNLQPTVAPSAVPDEHARAVPHALEVEEIAALVAVYAQGARRVREAGLDAIEIHGAHGYLVWQFLSPYTNRRDDSYGEIGRASCRE